MKKNVQQLLISYSNYYQIKFKLFINDSVYFSNFDNENECSIYDFNINNNEATLTCSKDFFEEQLKLISIAICEIMKINDIHYLFEKGLKESLDRDEKECFFNTYHTNQYSIGLIETNNTSEHLYEILKSMISFPLIQLTHNKKIAFLIPNEINASLMRELKDTLEAECYCRVYCSCSSGYDLDDLMKAFEEVSLYLGLMKKYEGSFAYANQKECFLPYLIDSIEEEKAKFILSKFDEIQLNQIDEELLNTIHVFLRNNLSIAETSRQLYLHRNTLIYRLEKIMYITGLDIRNFEEAIKMQILLLLKKRFQY